MKHLGKLWGSRDKQPILAIHGWQDNAGSFDSLAPLLSLNLPVLSIDLPGHGYSSHMPSGQFYYIFWDGVIILRRIVKHYKWNKVSQQSKLYNDDIYLLYINIIFIHTDNDFDFITCSIFVCRSYFNNLYNDAHAFI